MMNIGIVKRLCQFAVSGTAGTSSASSGDDFSLFTSAASGSVARYILARNLTGQGAWGSPLLDCAKNFDLAICLAMIFNHVDSKMRVVFGAPNAQPDAASAPLAGKGWGIEFGYVSSGVVRARLFAFDSYLTWSGGTIDVTNYGDGCYFLRKSGGNISLWKTGLNERIDTLATPVISMSGAPTSGAAGSVLLTAEMASGVGSSAANVFRILGMPMVRIWT